MQKHPLKQGIHPDIVRAYDIRGTFGVNLYQKDAVYLARCLVNFLLNFLREKDPITSPNPLCILIGRDGRNSSPLLHKDLKKTLLHLGVYVMDLGVVSTPMLYFFEKKLRPHGAVMITASHNPKDDNGFKIMALGQGVFGENLTRLVAPFSTELDENAPLTMTIEDALSECTNTPASPKKKPPSPPPHHGKTDIRPDNLKNMISHNSHSFSDISEYITHTLTALPSQKNLQNMRIAWDFGGGAVCAAKPLWQHLQGTHILLNDTFDPDFTAHAPDPTVPKNLEQLSRAVLAEQCDLGIAFDGDGDRVVAMDHTGAPLAGDRLLTLLAQEVLEENPGAMILADVKCSRIFEEEVKRLGGVPRLMRCGHAYIKAAIRETGALLAGEMSGHVFYADRNFGYDDGLYAGLRLIHMLSEKNTTLHDLDKVLPRYSTSPEIKIPYDGAKKFSITHAVKQHLKKINQPFREDDGVRVDMETGWWLLRASNTEDALTLRFEGMDDSALAAIQGHFTSVMHEVDVMFTNFFEGKKENS